MNISRILKRQPLSSSKVEEHFVDAGKKVVDLKAPASWKELTQEQLRYLLWLLCEFSEKTVVKTYLFVRLAGLAVVKQTDRGWLCRYPRGWWKSGTLFLQAGEVLSLLQQFAFIDRLDDMDVRLEDIRGFKAVDVRLHNVSFGDYLNIEKYYQLYLIHKQDRFIDTMATFLYLDKKGNHPKKIRLRKEERLGCFLWIQAVKKHFAEMFPHFFVKGEGDGDFDLIKQMDMQIRALTEGDVTKEKEIMNIDCWRALTELDAKAHDAAEIKTAHDRNK